MAYEYRVTRLVAGGEEELGVSAPATAGSGPPPPVEGFEVLQQGPELAFNWVHDEQRFYAVNILSEDSTGLRTRLNSQPIVLTMVPGRMPDSSSAVPGTLAYPRPMFRHQGFREGEQYTFYIEGVGYFGEATALSAPVTLAFDDTSAPPPAENLTATADSMRVSLDWDYTPVADLKAQSVYRSARSEGPFEKIATVGITGAYAETLAVPGPYYYKVEAADHSGNTSLSDMALVDVQDVLPPAMPTGLTIEADTGLLVLRWHMGTEPDLRGYHVFRTVDADDKHHYVLLNAEPTDTCFFRQRLPRNVKNTFHYFVVAVDTSFNRSPPSAVAKATLPDVVAPAAPSIHAVRYTDEGIELEWTPLADDDLAGYHMYRADSVSGGSVVQVNAALLGPASLRFTDRSALPNTEYLYQLLAIDSTGNTSPLSAPVQALKHRTPEAAGALQLSVKSQKRKKTNRLEWTDQSGTNPSGAYPPGTDQSGTAPGGYALLGYMVYRGTTERAMKPLSDLITTGNTFTDRALTHETYVYQVRAFTTGGQTIYSPLVVWKQR